MQRHAGAIRTLLYGLCVCTGDKPRNIVDYLLIQTHNHTITYTCILLFADPDLEETIEDLELMENSSTPITRDDITVDAISPTYMAARKPLEATNGSVLNRVPGGEDFLNRSMNGGIPNGYTGKDIGNYFHEKPGERPAPRVFNKLTPGKESMVIFNGEEPVISGNDTRVIPNENPSTRSFRTDPGGVVTFRTIDEEGNGDNYKGRLSSENFEDLPYPSVPRESSIMMPPIETSDSPKDKH